MFRRVVGEVEIRFDATECKITVSDCDEAATTSLSLDDLDTLIETLTTARREAEADLWETR